MASMTMHMPSMAPQGPSRSPALRPASPANNYQHQPLPNANQLQAVSAPCPGQGSAVSNLSLALPLSNSQSTHQQNAAPSTPLATASAIANSPDGSIGLLRVKLVDMLPEDGAPSPLFMRTVENLSDSLARHNAAIIELGGEDATLVRCALESARLYFRSRGGSGAAVTTWGGTDGTKSTGYIAAPPRELYLYRAGRATYEDVDHPPGMPEVFRCLGKASRASLSAIARHLRLRSDVFGSLLDDHPLPAGETSSSVLTVTSFHPAGGGGGGKAIVASETANEMEKGLLMLIASDTPGLQVCDANGRWFLADSGTGPGDLVILTGRALQHATAGLRKASTYRVVPLGPNSATGSAGRTSLAFRLMPRTNATIDSSIVADAGHSVPEGYGAVSVAAFMDDLTAAEALKSNGSENSLETMNASSEPSLRSVLSDPLTGALLEDAMVAHCGHSFGGATLKRVYDTNMCSSCGVAVEGASLIPNLALQAAAAAFRREERSRQLQGVIRGTKRRKEPSEQADPNRLKRPKQDHPSSPADKEHVPRTGGGGKGVQYPFSVNERVMIKGNKRTPEKFVGREAHITSQCLNGWYLLKTLDNGESVRLQYRSLQKSEGNHNGVSEEHTSNQEIIHA